MTLWYLRDGTPLESTKDNLRWIAALFESEEYRVVAQTELFGGFVVSTIWIGIGYSPPLAHQGFEPPLIFETMVFTPHWYGFDDLDQWRYATEEGAWFGHAAAVKFWRRQTL
ncbi:unnamed protein product, partial [marine sediment metagenome]